MAGGSAETVMAVLLLASLMAMSAGADQGTLENRRVDHTVGSCTVDDSNKVCYFECDPGPTGWVDEVGEASGSCGLDNALDASLTAEAALVRSAPDCDWLLGPLHGFCGGIQMGKCQLIGSAADGTNECIGKSALPFPSTPLE